MRNSIRIIAITIYLLLISTTLFADWELKTPGIAGGSMTARQQSGMVYIGNGRVILFGGRNGSTSMNDTWLLDINKNRWMRLTPTTIGGVMNPRYGSGLAYIGNESALLYGGYANSAISETWRFNYTTNSWTRLYPAVVGGSLNYIYAMGLCFIEEGKALMFGGLYSSSSIYNNTWLYDATQNRWTLMAPTITGENFLARYDLGMAYIGNGRVLMFGGLSASGYMNDTWVYDLAQNQWTKMNPSIVGGALSARSAVGMAYVGGDRVLLFGGTLSANSIKTNEVWMYDLGDNQWTNLTPTGSSGMPVARNAMGFASAGLGQVVMYGGANTSGVILNDTWRFSTPESIQDSMDWEAITNGIQFSWTLPEEFTGAQFSIFRDGVQIVPSLSPGTPANGLIPFTYLDPNPTPNKIYRYQIKESYPVMNMELFYPEIGVPYCQ